MSNYRFFPMLFMGNWRLWRRFKTADFGDSNYESVMISTQTYYLSTDGRVKLEWGNHVIPQICRHEMSRYHTKIKNWLNQRCSHFKIIKLLSGRYIKWVLIDVPRIWSRGTYTRNLFKCCLYLYIFNHRVKYEEH